MRHAKILHALRRKAGGRRLALPERAVGAVIAGFSAAVGQKVVYPVDLAFFHRVQIIVIGQKLAGGGQGAGGLIGPSTSQKVRDWYPGRRLDKSCSPRQTAV